MFQLTFIRCYTFLDKLHLRGGGGGGGYQPIYLGSFDFELAVQ